YIIKNAGFDEMVAGIKAIWNGKKFMQDQVKDTLKDQELYKTRYRQINIPRLTFREKEVLELIVAERTTKEIAEILFLSEKTIETHRGNLFIKMDSRNIAGIVKKAVDWGLVN